MRKVQAQIAGIQGADSGQGGSEASFDLSLEQLAGGSMATSALHLKVGATAHDQLMRRMLGVVLSRNGTTDRIIASMSA